MTEINWNSDAFVNLDAMIAISKVSKITGFLDWLYGHGKVDQ